MLWTEMPRPRSVSKAIPERLLLHVYHATHTILFFKKKVVYLFPGLLSILPLIERLYRFTCHRVFDYCDRAHKLLSKEEAVIMITIILLEIENPTEIETWEPSVLSHLKLVLQSRLKVFCSQISDFGAPKKFDLFRKAPNVVVAMMLSRVEELSSYVPRDYNISIAFFESNEGRFIPIEPPSKPGDQPACLLRRFAGNDYCNSSAETDSCSCGWISDSIPSSLLKFLGHSVHSFASYVHSDSRETRLEDADAPFNPRQALNTIFKGIGKNSSSLRNRMIVFEGVLLVGFCFLLDSIDCLTAEGGVTEEIACCNDQVIHLAEKLRQQLFTCILPPAVTMYHDFCNSERRSVIHARTTNELFFEFYWWARERPDFETELVTDEVAQIIEEDLVQRDRAKRSMPLTLNYDLSSGEDQVAFDLFSLLD